MHQSFLKRSKWLIFVALFVLILTVGCSDDESTNPGPAPVPAPSLSLTLQDAGGLYSLKVVNSGGAMTKSSPLVVNYGDGYSETVTLDLEQSDSMVCDMSNVHGAISVVNDEWSLSASGDDCLCQFFEDISQQVVLADYVPSPLNVSTFVLCTYTTNLNNLAADNVTTELTRTDEGLTLKYVYSGIHGQLRSTAPGGLCVDLSGSVTISSVVITANFEFGSGEDPIVELGTTDAVVNGLSVNVDGAFGFIVNFILGFVENTFAHGVEDGLVTAINNTVPADLSNLIIVKSACAD